MPLMRKSIALILLVAVALLAGGCDFFRTVAGRPTSEDIAAKRLIIEETIARQKAYDDSVAAVQRRIRKAEADSIAAVAAFEGAGVKMYHASQIHSFDASSLSSRYYMVVGTFSSKTNAQAMLQRTVNAGLESEIISYKKGTSAVVVCPNNRIKDMLASFSCVCQLPFCPSDAWILVND